jgi:hypothetical protein
VLFNPGGSFDKAFYANGSAALQFEKDYYPNIGDFQGGYLDKYFEELVGHEYLVGPAFKSFPFYEDASKLRNIIKKL